MSGRARNEAERFRRTLVGFAQASAPAVGGAALVGHLLANRMAWLLGAFVLTVIYILLATLQAWAGSLSPQGWL